MARISHASLAARLDVGGGPGTNVMQAFCTWLTNWSDEDRSSVHKDHYQFCAESHFPSSSVLPLSACARQIK